MLGKMIALCQQASKKRKRCGIASSGEVCERIRLGKDVRDDVVKQRKEGAKKKGRRRWADSCVATRKPDK